MKTNFMKPEIYSVKWIIFQSKTSSKLKVNKNKLLLNRARCIFHVNFALRNKIKIANK